MKVRQLPPSAQTPVGQNERCKTSTRRELGKCHSVSVELLGGQALTRLSVRVWVAVRDTQNNFR